DLRQARVDGVERRRAFFDRFFDVGGGDAGEGGEGLVEGDEHARLFPGDRGHRGRERLERAEEAGEVRRRRGQGRGRGFPFFEQSAQGPDRFVQLRTTAGECVAEARQVALDRLPGRRVEHVEEFVDVPRFRGRVADRDRFAGLVAGRRAARG